MEIEFCIPHGTMRVNLDTFLSDAGRPQIRRMLKCIRDSDYGPGTVRAIQSWLLQGVENESSRARDAASRYAKFRTELAAKEDYYRQMQSPCYAAFTRDKAAISQVKKDISGYKGVVTKSKRAMDAAAKRCERYRGILEDTEKIIGLRRK